MIYGNIYKLILILCGDFSIPNFGSIYLAYNVKSLMNMLQKEYRALIWWLFIVFEQFQWKSHQLDVYLFWL